MLAEQMVRDIPSSNTHPPLIVHIIHRLAVGGLENGLVNLINHMPRTNYRHTIVCMTESTTFRDRLRRPDVPVIAVHRREGKDFRVYLRLWRILRALRPDIVHTRNLPTVDCLALSALAGVRARVHSEHGLEVRELDGTNSKYKLLRRVLRPTVHRYITVSADLADWLVKSIDVSPSRVTQVCNGVDTQLFRPRTAPRARVGPADFACQEGLVLGTVGRMVSIKDQLTLVRAFLRLLDTEPEGRHRCRLVIIGDGALRKETLDLVRAANAEHLSWLPGERADIPEIMRGLDLFVLPSLKEGISNTILEAMASGLPVVATRVGGNPELIEEGVTGLLVPPANPVAMAEAIRSYLQDPGLLTRHGQAGRKRAETQFSMEGMVKGYLAVYDSVLNRKRKQSALSPQHSASQ